jgi:mRNA interferase RelE/StbE
MRYRIEIRSVARDEIKRLPGAIRASVRQAIRSLADDPRPPGAKELRDLPGRYRIWVYAWRVMYRVDDDVVVVEVLRVRQKTGPETYEGLEADEPQ